MVQQERKRLARARHWKASLRVVLGLTVLWLGITFLPPLLGRSSGFFFGLEVWGAPLPVWMAAQGAPIVYVLIVWYYERRMNRLDKDLNKPID